MDKNWEIKIERAKVEFLKTQVENAKDEYEIIAVGKMLETAVLSLKTLNESNKK